MPPQVVEKWSRDVLGEGFVPFPKKLLRTMHKIFPDSESLKDLAVILAIVDFKRPNLSRMPSLEYLAFLAGLGEEEFQRILGRLEAQGFVRVAGNPDAMDISLNGFIDAIEETAG
jgi:hypothetical protein